MGLALAPAWSAHPLVQLGGGGHVSQNEERLPQLKRLCRAQQKLRGCPVGGIARRARQDENARLRKGSERRSERRGASQSRGDWQPLQLLTDADEVLALPVREGCAGVHLRVGREAAMCRDASTSTCGAHRTGDGLRRNCCVRVAACACGARVACAGAWPRFTKREPMCRHTCDSTSCACAGWRRLLRRVVAPGQWHEVASTIWRRGIDSRTQLVPSSRRWPAWRRVKAGWWGKRAGAEALSAREMSWVHCAM